MLRKQISTAVVLIAGAIAPAFSQAPAQPQKSLERRGPDLTAQPVQPAQAPAAAAQPAKKETKEAPSDYILGADDQISLWTPEAEELNGKTLRVEGNGNITIPLIGTLKASGLTAPQLSAEVSKKLEKYYVKPQVVISVTEYKSQPVSVFGAVNNPGVQQVQGRKSLVEVLSAAGGPRQDAGPTVFITRQAEWGTLPLEGATTDPSGRFSTAEVDLKAVTSSERPQDNIAVKPNDVISVPPAKLVYVIGEVERGGGFVLTQRQGMSVIQALSMAGGMKSTASPSKARILRKDESGPKEGKPIDLTAMLKGKEPDFELRPDDILWVPDSRSKKAGIRAAEAVLQTVTGVAIWRVGQR